MIARRAGYYYETLEKLSAFPLWKKVTLKELSPSRGVTQRAYSDMSQKIYGMHKNDKFSGSIIDYFCWVSMMVVLSSFQAFEKMDDFVDIEVASENKKLEMNRMELGTVHTWQILNGEVHAKNLCRLYLSDSNCIKSGLIELYGIKGRNTEESFIAMIKEAVEKKINIFLKYK